ncbi:Tetratricopeptide repeat-containing protein [Ekhidna lutea]|uniref:histidine kinase n=1 Tax=Ekhidna lutea TaxID=447679 RepID=A0A239GNL3_EKHLU|nr:ATP-binding protein [Ekhidna lutea]SNS70561.1 Tetratricopeptide repeat-containing protein [Ekhidna lutea]
MRKLIIISTLVILQQSGFTQNIHNHKTYRDSLKSQLFVADNDSTLVQILNSLAESYWISEYDSGIFYARNGLLIARKSNYQAGEVNSLLTLSLVSSVIGDVVKGYEYSSMAIKLSEELKNERLLSKSYSVYGEALSSAGKYRESIAAIKQALNFKSKDQFQLMTNCAQLADCYTKLNLTDSANFFADITDKAMNPSGNNPPYPLRMVANMHRRLGNKAEAISYYRKAKSASVYYDDDVSLSHTYLDMSRFYSEINRDSTFHYAELAIKSAKKSRSIVLVIKSSEYLSNLYAPINKQIALNYAVESNAARDSLKYILQDQSINSFNDFDQKLRELEIQQTENELRSKIRQNTFLGSTFTLLVIAFALWRNNRIKQKGKKRVEKAYDKLKTAQQKLIHAEKMASLGEITAGIAHEIQNPLNFVNNFSDLNDELLDELRETLRQGDHKEAEQLIHDLSENEKKIIHHGRRAEEIVKSMLLHSRTGPSEKEETDINALADECLSLSYHGIRAKDDQFRSNFELISDPTLPKIQVIRQDIGRVLLNLINNAFYAAMEKAKTEGTEFKPHIKVVTRSGQNEIILSVSDNGTGIPQNIIDKIFQPFFTTKAAGEGTGLGLSMSYDIVTKGHGGSIEVQSEEGKGTSFIFKLPITN